MLLLLLVLLLVLGCGGSYYSYDRWGPAGGGISVGTVLVILLVIYLLRGFR